MKATKRILTLVLALAMVFALTATAFAEQTEGKTASITINTDESFETGKQAYTYKAYKIFDANYSTLAGTNTQSEKDPTYTPADAKVAYFMKTGNPWIATVQGMTDYFTVTAAADGSGYVVALKDGVADTAATAKAIANVLKGKLSGTDAVSLSGDYAAIEITAGQGAVAVQPGYYMIVGDTAANLAAVTTNITMIEKNEYPKLIKEFSDETTVGTFENQHVDESSSKSDSVQIGDTVSYILTFTIPSGANQQMVITDTYTSGLDPVLESGKVKITVNGLTGEATASEPASNSFTVTIDADTVAANAGKTIEIVYEAVVTKDAWHQTEQNDGKVKYGNSYETSPDHVDSVLYNLKIDKKAESESGESLKGAQFALYRTDSQQSLTKAPVSLMALTDEELSAASITKVADTVYYRVAQSAESGATTTIDMTDASSAVIYGLDGDSTYSVRETKAPVGYNILKDDVNVTMSDANHVQPIVNKSGSVLPSTGGIGTTIFYIVGGILVLGAGVVLIARRRMSADA